jgi:hexokinase
MSMGKGFTITTNLDLRKQLLSGYQKAAESRSLPPIRIVAIANDAVATLVSFAYQMEAQRGRKAAMAIIVGTGNNATVPLTLQALHPNKRPEREDLLTDGTDWDDVKIVVNTEWSIKGTAPPLHDLNLVTKWDKILDAAGNDPGFMPFEYMTAGRYLGELGRIIVHDYLTNYLQISESFLPLQILTPNGISTTLLGRIRQPRNLTEPSLLSQVETQIPSIEAGWRWTQEAVEVVYEIAKAVQVRAAGMTASAVIGLLACAGDINIPRAEQNGQSDSDTRPITELMVGFTGGCIVHFQDYLEDCQAFIHNIMDRHFQGHAAPKILLAPCHDGGIMGAGILAGTVTSLEQDA